MINFGQLLAQTVCFFRGQTISLVLLKQDFECWLKCELDLKCFLTKPSAHAKVFRSLLPSKAGLENFKLEDRENLVTGLRNLVANRFRLSEKCIQIRI